MRSGRDAASVWAMPGTSRTIRLELDAEPGLLRGRVAEADHTDQEFEGWLELLTVLGTVLDGPASGDAPASLRSTSDRRENLP
jgi:hypothetical protein